LTRADDSQPPGVFASKSSISQTEGTSSTTGSELLTSPAVTAPTCRDDLFVPYDSASSEATQNKSSRRQILPAVPAPPTTTNNGYCKDNISNSSRHLDAPLNRQVIYQCQRPWSSTSALLLNQNNGHVKRHPSCLRRSRYSFSDDNGHASADVAVAANSSTRIPRSTSASAASSSPSDYAIKSRSNRSQSTTELELKKSVSFYF
jgi:hypothetical protein